MSKCNPNLGVGSVQLGALFMKTKVVEKMIKTKIGLLVCITVPNCIYGGKIFARKWVIRQRY